VFLSMGLTGLGSSAIENIAFKFNYVPLKAEVGFRGWAKGSRKRSDKKGGKEKGKERGEGVVIIFQNL